VYNDTVYMPPTQQQPPYGGPYNPQYGGGNDQPMYNYNQPPIYNAPQQMSTPQQSPPTARFWQGNQKNLEPGMNPQFVPRETRYIPETRIECKPAYFYSPWGIIRLIEMALVFFTLGLFTVTCGGGYVGTCVVYLNEFGRVAEGLGYNVFAALVVFMMTSVLVIMYSINAHRAMPPLVMAVERGMYAFACLLLFIMAVIMSYYASAAGWENDFGHGLRDLGRQVYSGIQPSWIAAAVFSWLLFVIYLADLLAQCALGYPTVRHVNS